MSSRLSVREQQRSRSKSPSGRESAHSRSDVRDTRSDTRRESDRRKSSKAYSGSESDSDSDKERYRSDKRSSKKYYDSDSQDDRYKQRSSRSYADGERQFEEKSSGPRPLRNQIQTITPSDIESDDDREKSGRRNGARRKSDSDSDDRRNGKSGSNRTKVPRGGAPPSSAGAPAYGQGLVQSPVNNQPPYGQPFPYSQPVQPGYAPQPPGAFPETRPHPGHETRHLSYVGQDPRYAPPPQAPLVPQETRPRAASNANPQYANIGQFQYAQVDPQVAFKYDNKSAVSQYDPRNKAQIVDVDPRRSDSRVQGKRYTDDKYSASTAEKERRYTDDKYKHRERGDERVERLGSNDVEKSSARRMSRLSIGAATGAATLGVAGMAANGTSNGHGKPPASPLLEAYHGTYQSISPMPSALTLAEHKNDSDISDVELESDDSGIADNDPNADIKRQIRAFEKEKLLIQKQREKEEARKKEQARRKELETGEYERRRPSYQTRDPDNEFEPTRVSPKATRKKVSWYDAESDAKEIAAILKGSKAPSVKPLIKIIPHLSPDDLDALKLEYKNHAKISGQGINMSKHIKARVGGHLGKAAYACSLGQYESDAFWANCFYQSGASRRELLIESLMGRTNQQIREIKNFFKDKKYDDDLEKCLRAELKADKFRSAILLALEERRQAESLVLDPRLVKADVVDLYEALNSAGGESAMMKIIVLRSDPHLREVMRQYERTYGRNFARDMIGKSRNLVGETLAHILNGALNKPTRDAMLLHQAIAETAPGKERAELLMSRLVRLHWDPKHLEKVKAVYRQRYGMTVVEAIEDEIQAHMKTEEGHAWTNFCIELVKSSE